MFREQYVICKGCQNDVMPRCHCPDCGLLHVPVRAPENERAAAEIEFLGRGQSKKMRAEFARAAAFLRGDPRRE